jgi:hypothetical protein
VAVGNVIVALLLALVAPLLAATVNAILCLAYPVDEVLTSVPPPASVVAVVNNAIYQAVGLVGEVVVKR